MTRTDCTAHGRRDGLKNKIKTNGKFKKSARNQFVAVYISTNMAILVVEFSREGYKIRKVSGYMIIYQLQSNEIIEF